MSKVLLLGARGMLGSSLGPSLEKYGHNVLRQSRGDGLCVKLDLLSHIDWASCLKYHQPDVIVNLAAATDVDRCELDPRWAFEGNMAPLIACMEAISLTNLRPHFVHISTDQVYDGLGPHPEHHVSPGNVYGLTKLAAELLIKDYSSTILRTNFFGLSRAHGRPSFSDWIVESLKVQMPITLFQDVLFSAIHMDNLCEVIRLAIEKRPLGVFNVGCADGISKAEFGLELATRLGLCASSIRVGSVNELSLRARRPLDMRMCPVSFEHIFSIAAPSMASQIDQVAIECCG